MKKMMVIIAGVLTAQITLAAGEHGSHEPEAVTTPQTLCPVMEGNPIDRNLYTDYQGERVYFCCSFCIDAFEKEPQKYLSKLPQFTAMDNHEHGTTTGFKTYRLTKPLGITTFSLILLTATAGIFRRKLKRRFLRIHKILAVATVVTATLHVITVWIGH